MVSIGTQLLPCAEMMLHPSIRRLGYGPVRFTLSDALGMVEQGILPEDSTVELLDGSLVYRDRFDLQGSEIVEGKKHNFTISALADLGSRINTDRRHLRRQSTLVCAETHAPIPDASILRGTFRDYADRLPNAVDAWSVIEVADSSYERDSGEKSFGYARAGIGQYIILNLRNRTAEVHSNPDAVQGIYPPPQIVAPSQMLQIRVGQDEWLEVGLSELLPR